MLFPICKGSGDEIADPLDSRLIRSFFGVMPRVADPILQNHYVKSYRR